MNSNLRQVYLTDELILSNALRQARNKKSEIAPTKVLSDSTVIGIKLITAFAVRHLPHSLDQISKETTREKNEKRTIFKIKMSYTRLLQPLCACSLQLLNQNNSIITTFIYFFDFSNHYC